MSGFATIYRLGYDIGVLVTDAAHGTLTYTVGKRSDLVQYPLGPGDKSDSLLGMLRAVEPGWGGGSTIGGSPRNQDGSSSKLGPEEVFGALLGMAEEYGR
jgi:hypothetical protein